MELIGFHKRFKVGTIALQVGILRNHVVDILSGQLFHLGDGTLGQTVHVTALRTQANHILVGFAHTVAHAHINHRTGLGHSLGSGEFGICLEFARHIHKHARAGVHDAVVTTQTRFGNILIERPLHAQLTIVFIHVDVAKGVVAVGAEQIGVPFLNLLDVGTHQSLEGGICLVALVDVLKHFALAPLPHVVHAMGLGQSSEFGIATEIGNLSIHKVGVIARALNLQEAILGHIAVHEFASLHHFFLAEGVASLVGEHLLGIGLGQVHGLGEVIEHFNTIALERDDLVTTTKHLVANANIDGRGIVFGNIRLGVILALDTYILAGFSIFDFVIAVGRFLCRGADGEQGHQQRSNKEM